MTSPLHLPPTPFVEPNIKEQWRFRPCIQFEDGHREPYYAGRYEDEYGATFGSFQKDVEKMSEKLGGLQPELSVIEFWLERDSVYQYNDRFDTKYVVTQRLYKQEQTTKLWWVYATPGSLCDFLSDSENIDQDHKIVVHYFDDWHGTHKAFLAGHKRRQEKKR